MPRYGQRTYQYYQGFQAKGYAADGEVRMSFFKRHYYEIRSSRRRISHVDKAISDSDRTPAHMAAKSLSPVNSGKSGCYRIYDQNDVIIIDLIDLTKKSFPRAL